MDFINVYNKSIIGLPIEKLGSMMIGEESTIIKGMISPESKVWVNFFENHKFQLDKKGMEKIIKEFENIWSGIEPNLQKSLYAILFIIYEVLIKFYKYNNDMSEEELSIRESIRNKKYEEACDNCLSLSEIEGLNIALCIEFSSVAHQLLTILEKSNIIDYESHIVNSFCSFGENITDKHSFLVLKNKQKPTVQYLVDIINPLQVKKNETSEPKFGLAMYPITEEDYQRIKEGKGITPKSIYEQDEMSIVDEKRLYGANMSVILNKNK